MNEERERRRKILREEVSKVINENRKEIIRRTKERMDAEKKLR